MGMHWTHCNAFMPSSYPVTVFSWSFFWSCIKYQLSNDQIIKSSLLLTVPCTITFRMSSVVKLIIQVPKRKQLLWKGVLQTRILHLDYGIYPVLKCCEHFSITAFPCRFLFEFPSCTEPTVCSNSRVMVGLSSFALQFNFRWVSIKQGFFVCFWEYYNVNYVHRIPLTGIPRCLWTLPMFEHLTIVMLLKNMNRWKCGGGQFLNML